MRKTKIIKLDNRKITVFELRIGDILDLAACFEKGDVLGAIRAEWPRFCNLPEKDLLNLAPSELWHLYDAFKEVNADFLALARAAGLEAIVVETFRKITSDFGVLAADLLKPGTPAASTTDGADLKSL